MCGAKLSRSHRPISYYREACHPKIFKEAMEDFKQFFKDKTKIAWDNRLEGIIVQDTKAFRYTPPIVGRPVGILPFGYLRPEERLDSETETSGSGSGNDTNTTTSTTASESVEYDTDSEVEDSDNDEEPSTTDTNRTLYFGQQGARIYIPSEVVSFISSYDYQNSQTQSTPTSTLSFDTEYTNGHETKTLPR